MGANERTPLLGWPAALVHLVIWGGVAFGVSMLLIWGIDATLNALEISRVELMLVYIVGGLVGWAEGWLMARRLVDKSGVEGKTLLVIVFLLLVFLHVGVYALVPTVFGATGSLYVFLCVILAGAGVMSAGRTLLLD